MDRKRAALMLIVCSTLGLLMCVFAFAATGSPAPQFNVRTLDGATFTNYSLSDNVVLLQFWTTWCQYCRRDQAAVDNIEREFADKGLVVLAINVGEPEQKVRSYLSASPRSCRTALDQDQALARRFGAGGGFPFYLVIDRKGNIAGTQKGSGGEESLRKLLRAAFSDDRSTRRSLAETTPLPYASPVQLPPAKTEPWKPLPPAVFLLKSGERVESTRYLISGGSLKLEVAGRQRTIPLSDLNVSETISQNRKRGIDVKIPAKGNEVFLSF